MQGLAATRRLTLVCVPQVDAVKKFWSQFGINVVDHHMHEEGVLEHSTQSCIACCNSPNSNLAKPIFQRRPMGVQAERPTFASRIGSCGTSRVRVPRNQGPPGRDVKDYHFG